MPAAACEFKSFKTPVRLDWEALVNQVLLRKGTPNRTFFMELYLDREVAEAVDQRFGISASQRLRRDDPHFSKKQLIAVYRFLGYDTIPAGVGGEVRLNWDKTADTTSNLSRAAGRAWMNEHKGPVTTWEDFEKYPWDEAEKCNTADLEWYAKNLPDDMCLCGRGCPFCEHLCWLFGYETLCYALYDQRDLVLAVKEKIEQRELKITKILLEEPRVKIMWGSDDMGFKTGLLISPQDTRDLVLSGHKKIAALWHQSGRPYMLHCCGKRTDIVEDLIEDVKVDAIHSFEDTIELVTDAKRAYGQRMSLIGGIDVDFLCRSSEAEIRRRVCQTLDCCQPGGGFALGTGNTVANYIPLDNYLAMMDEGRLR